MPVDLSLLPAQLPKRKKINFMQWGMVLLAMIIIACIAMTAISYFYPVSPILFVSFSIVVPLVTWLFAFAINLVWHGYKAVYVDEWNKHLKDNQEELIIFARRGLYVLFSLLKTQHGDSGNGKGVANHQLSKLSLSSKTNSYLAPNKIVDDKNHNEHLLNTLNKWKNEKRLLVNHLPSDLNLHVKFFINPQYYSTVDLVWLKSLADVITATSVEAVDIKYSDEFIERWLDDEDNDNDLLLIISANFEALVSENSGEFMSMMLLAGEQAIKHQAFTDLAQIKTKAKIFRRAKTDNINKTIDDALLWGGRESQDYDGIWFNAISQEQNTDIMKYLSDINFKVKDIFNIDTAIGYAGQNTYWLALALAIENSLLTQNKQFIMIGKPDLYASVIDCIH